MFDLTGRCALVTGASRGLGRHFAHTLAKAGAKVALAARTVELLEQVGAEIADAGGESLVVPLDVTDSANVEQAIAETEDKLGPLDILVNNSGVAIAKPTLDMTEDEWDTVIDTDLKGAWLMAREAAARMAQRGEGGKIINIASIGGLITLGQLSSYGAAKAGLIHLTHALAV